MFYTQSLFSLWLYNRTDTSLADTCAIEKAVLVPGYGYPSPVNLIVGARQVLA